MGSRVCLLQPWPGFSCHLTCCSPTWFLPVKAIFFPMFGVWGIFCGARQSECIRIVYERDWVDRENRGFVGLFFSCSEIYSSPVALLTRQLCTVNEAAVAGVEIQDKAVRWLLCVLGIHVSLYRSSLFNAVIIFKSQVSLVSPLNFDTFCWLNYIWVLMKTWIPSLTLHQWFGVVMAPWGNHYCWRQHWVMLVGIVWGLVRVLAPHCSPHISLN